MLARTGRCATLKDPMMHVELGRSEARLRGEEARASDAVPSQMTTVGGRCDERSAASCPAESVPGGTPEFRMCT